MNLSIIKFPGFEQMLTARGTGLEGGTAVVSGSGNVAIHAIKKLQQLGASVVACSDSTGYVHDPGGVATSALEMQQNASRDSWTFDFTETRLADIMRKIHVDCEATADEFGHAGDLVLGANIAGFRRVARAMVAFGVI